MLDILVSRYGKGCVGGLSHYAFKKEMSYLELQEINGMSKQDLMILLNIADVKFDENDVPIESLNDDELKKLFYQFRENNFKKERKLEKENQGKTSKIRRKIVAMCY